MHSSAWMKNLLEAFVEGFGGVFGKGRRVSEGRAGSRRALHRRRSRQNSRQPEDPHEKGTQMMHRRMMNGRH